MSNTWFTSDLHFGHVNILKYAPQRFAYLGIDAPASLVARCYEEVEAVSKGIEAAHPVSNAEIAEFSVAMNEGIVGLWNAQVAPDDTVWVIGDVAMGLVHDTIKYATRLNGTKHLCLGNHDRPHPIATKNEDKRKAWAAEYREAGFGDQFFQDDMVFDGITARVCHFPYRGNDHTMERYNAYDIAKYVPTDDGGPLVHGHVHDLYATRANMYNLGIDAWDGVFQTAEAIGAYFRSKGFTA